MKVIFQPTLNDINFDFVVRLVIRAYDAIERRSCKSVFSHIAKEVVNRDRRLFGVQLQSDIAYFGLYRDAWVVVSHLVILNKPVESKSILLQNRRDNF